METRILFTKSKALLLMGTILLIMVWIADSIIEAKAFEQATIFTKPFSPESIQLLLKLLALFLIITFSLYWKDLLDELKAKCQQLNNEISERKKTEEELAALAVTDPLTQLHNRRKFDEILSYEISKERRYKAGLSIILCDIDHFKLVNDTYGHTVGDKILIRFSHDIKNLIRSSDLFARWGGEEFVLLLPNTNLEIARSVAEKIRKHIEETRFGIANQITASFGVATLKNNDSEASFVSRADHALYQAKEKGRNNVAIEDVHSYVKSQLRIV